MNYSVTLKNFCEDRFAKLFYVMLPSVLVRSYDSWLPVLTMVPCFMFLAKDSKDFLRYLKILLFEVSRQLWTFHGSVSACWPTTTTLSWRLCLDTLWLPVLGELKTLKSVPFQETCSKVGLEWLHLLCSTISQLVERFLSLKPGLLK